MLPQNHILFSPGLSNIKLPLILPTLRALIHAVIGIAEEAVPFLSSI